MFPHELEDTFGDVVRKASRGTKTSVDALARETGVGAKRLSDFIGDKAEPSTQEALAIAAALQLDPKKLVDSRLGHWLPDERPMPHFVIQQINAPQPSNGYFIMLDDRKTGAFVDPAGRPEAIIDGFKQAGIEPQYLLLTHKHLDHTDALAAVRKAFPNAKPVIHHIDAIPVGDAARGAIDIVDGASLPFGDGEIRMLYTPGHTDGSCCFLYKGHVFTGDTMFASSVGALFGERFGYDDLLRNVREKLLSLPESTVVFPGHGPSTTIAQERAHNPFFLS
jgi:hydroxyacylglutathione hydrolase